VIQGHVVAGLILIGHRHSTAEGLRRVWMERLGTLYSIMNCANFTRRPFFKEGDWKRSRE
jgi:hypothetical protein